MVLFADAPLFLFFSLLVIACVAVNVNETGGRHLGAKFCPLAVELCIYPYASSGISYSSSTKSKFVHELCSAMPGQWIPVWSAVLLLC